MRLVAVVALAGCYHVKNGLDDCLFACDQQGACPAGLACGAGGLCSAAGGDTCTTGPHGDGGVDAIAIEIDAAPGCYGSDQRFGVYCVPPSTPDATFKQGINTSASTCPGPLEVHNGTMVCVIYAHQLSMEQTVTVTGSFPLVLVADQIKVLGVVDMAARGATPGAGGHSACATGPQPLGYGGAGGTFGTAGGAGGGPVSQPQQPADAITPDPPPYVIQGGCPGMPGTSALTVPPTSAPGSGGGAIVFVGGQITISGTILVGGGGGAGGKFNSSGGGGGAGGGAGGLIGIDVVTLGGGGELLAGGGGGGSSGNKSLDGNAGANGLTVTPASGGLPAQTGGGQGGAGCGGLGTSSMPAGDGDAAPSNSYSGSGGGGGCGRIIVDPPRMFTGVTVPPLPP